jgi:hypothetical protein
MHGPLGLRENLTSVRSSRNRIANDAFKRLKASVAIGNLHRVA